MKKILVIDYDQASLAALRKTLIQEGFDVTVAGDGQAGWEKFQSEKPDLVLMEAMLSKIHGFELCDRITKDPVRKVPVFIMTGVYKDRVYRTEALRTYGASEYFEKPLDMLKFVASIHAVLTVPDIKPGPEVKPGNGEPVEGPGPVPVVKPLKEEPRRVEPQPEVRPAREDSPRTRPAPGHRPAMEEGLSLESVLNVRPAKEEYRRPEPGHDIRPASTMIPKVKRGQDGKFVLGDDLQLESLLNIAPTKDDSRRPEPLKGGRPGHSVSNGLDERPHDHTEKDQQAEDIDKLLKTTLSDFGLESEKKKTARAVPHPVPAPQPPPDKPKAVAPAPAPAHQKPRPFGTSVPPAAPEEKPKAATPPPLPAAVAEKPKSPQAQPQSRPKAMSQPVQPAPAPPKPKAQPKPEPNVPEEEAAPKESPLAHESRTAAEARMFKDIYEVEKKKSPAPFIAVGAGLVIVAVVGYFILRPKPVSNPAGNMPKNPARVIPSAASDNTPDASLPSLSEEKLKAVNPKAKTGAQAVQNHPADPLPTAEDAIVPSRSLDISRLAIPGAAGDKPGAKPVDAKQADAKAPETKTGDAKSAESLAGQVQGQPPVRTEAAPPQGSTGTGDDAAGQPAAAARANPGDLVDLAAADEQPKVQKSVDPLYPAQASRFGKEGSVTVNALIDETGSVINTGILKGLKDDMGLEKAAADAVRKWKFQPAKKDGVNVKVWKPVVVIFKANRSRQN
ncbi:MAG: TonB family protein [Candidatus Aminicenantales bacterium]